MNGPGDSLPSTVWAFDRLGRFLASQEHSNLEFVYQVMYVDWWRDEFWNDSSTLCRIGNKRPRVLYQTGCGSETPKKCKKTRENKCYTGGHSCRFTAVTDSSRPTYFRILGQGILFSAESAERLKGAWPRQRNTPPRLHVSSAPWNSPQTLDYGTFAVSEQSCA